jgi:hypothetical protein
VAAVEDAARPAGLGAAARVPVGAGAPAPARPRRARSRCAVACDPRTDRRRSRAVSSSA